MSRPFKSFVVAGGTGNLGKPIVQALVKHGFQVSVLRRIESKQINDNEIYTRVRVFHVNYNDQKALSEIMKGNQVVIDALSVFRTFDGKGKNFSENLAKAAAEAKVELFVPNDFGMDHAQIEARNDPPMNPFHSGHVQFRKWLNDELNLRYLTICNGMFANRGAFQRVSFADENTHTASLVGGGVNKFTVTNEKDVGRFLGLAFNNLSRDELTDKQLYCVGARISWQELFSEVEKRIGVKWTINTIDLDTAKKMMIPNANPNNPAESVLTFVQYTQFYESSHETHNDNDRVGFVPEINPVDAFLAKQYR